MQDLSLMPELTDAVTDMGYTRPTPIQARAIPVALSGRDLIACAATGTGKTAAFLLPILQRLRQKQSAGCRALILSPTRELALQIDEQALALGYHLGLSAVAVVGGMEMAPQERALRDGSDIVVATPGRLMDHMRFSYVDLRSVEVLVLDEADRMLDMGFLPDIQRILAALPASRQTLLFSATMSPRIRSLAGEILRDPVEVTVDRQKPATGIAQSACTVAQDRKAALLSRLLRRDDMRSVLVFVGRKAEADRLARSVTRGGVAATSIHADRSQEDRVAALESFRRGDCPVLVATDVAARGLDVNGISHVINFDVPHSVDDYIHRAGRTARAGAVGEVITFVTRLDESRMNDIRRAVGTISAYDIPAGFEVVGSEGGRLESPRGGLRSRRGRTPHERGAAPRSAQNPSGLEHGPADAAPAPTRRRQRRRPVGSVAGHA